MTTKTKLPTKQQFEAYERVRREGYCNMYYPNARALTGLSNEVYVAVTKNYAALMEKYPEVRRCPQHRLGPMSA